MIRTTIKWQKPSLRNGIWCVLCLTSLVHVPSNNMVEAVIMADTAASYQGAKKMLWLELSCRPALYTVYDYSPYFKAHLLFLSVTVSEGLIASVSPTQTAPAALLTALSTQRFNQQLLSTVRLSSCTQPPPYVQNCFYSFQNNTQTLLCGLLAPFRS